MGSLPYCIFQEAGPYPAAGVAVIYALLFLAALTWLVRAVNRLLRAPKYSTDVSSLAVDAKNRKASAKGGGTIVVLLALGMCGGLLLLAYIGWEWFEGRYSVVINSDAPVSLEQIRDQYADRTQTSILVAADVQSFQVKGRVAGQCVPDLFLSICRRHPTEVACIKSLWDQALEVRKP